MLTLTPANFVPGEAATALGATEAAAEVLGATLGATDALPVDGAADGDGLAELEHAVRTRIGMIAAATVRNRDFTLGPPLDPRSVVQHTEHTAMGWTVDGRRGGVKMPNDSQHADRVPAGRSRHSFAEVERVRWCRRRSRSC